MNKVTISKSPTEKFNTELRAYNWEYGNFPFKLVDDDNECEATEKFVHFIEKSGIPKILIEAVSTLNELPVKPDNPVNWLRAYFREDAPERQDEMEQEITALRNEIIEEASKVSYLREEEAVKMKMLRRLKESQLDINYSTTDASDLFVENMYSSWEVQPDPYFRTTGSTQKIFSEIRRAEKGETKINGPIEIEKVANLKKECEQSSEEEVATEAEEPERFREIEADEETLVRQLDENNMGGYNPRKHLTISLGHQTNDKYLHFNSPVDSSDSEENLRKGLSDLRGSLFAHSVPISSVNREKEGWLEADRADQNPTTDFGSIKKTKKVKGRTEHPHPPKTPSGDAGKQKRKADESKKEAEKMKKSGTKEHKHSRGLEEHEYNEELRAEDDAPVHAVEKMIDLPKGPGEEKWENIPESYWKTDMNFCQQRDSEESDSEESWATFLSKFISPLDAPGGWDNGNWKSWSEKPVESERCLQMQLPVLGVVAKAATCDTLDT